VCGNGTVLGFPETGSERMTKDEEWREFQRVKEFVESALSEYLEIVEQVKLVQEIMQLIPKEPRKVAYVTPRSDD
jgi:hypothetical protein